MPLHLNALVKFGILLSYISLAAIVNIAVVVLFLIKSLNGLIR